MTWVKICGLTRVDEAVAVAEAGADAIGLNFFPNSPRAISFELATEIVAELRQRQLSITAVGVIPGAKLLELADFQRIGLESVQIYPDLSAIEPWLPTAELLGGIGWLAAFRVREADDLVRIETYLEQCRQRRVSPQAVLIDSYVPGVMGGTGHKAPWHLLADFQPGLPLILAGGLTPGNLAAALEQVRPWGVDVASGVESEPGRKDGGKLFSFLQIARRTAPSR